MKRAKKRIMIDPGHGGSDPGATYEGIQEADINLNVALLAAKKLVLAGHDVFISRDACGVAKVPNKERARNANAGNIDIFISIHCNAAASARAEDTEIIYCPGSVKGEKLARCIYDAMMEAGGELSDAGGRGIKTDTDTGRGPFTVLRRTRMPAVIVEMGFMSNKGDREFISSAAGQEAAANAISAGVRAFFFDQEAGRQDGGG